MPTVRYTDGTLGAAGVYVREVRPSPIANQPQFVLAGRGGTAVRGPVNKPIQVVTTQGFLNTFGGRNITQGGAIASGLWTQILGKRVGVFWAVRAAASDATAATANAADITPTDIVQIDASSVGSWGNGVTYEIVDATDADPNHWDLILYWRAGEQVTAGGTPLGGVRIRNLDTTAGNNNLASKIGSADERLVDLTKLADGRPLNTVSPVALTTGSDGTIADTDYTATGKVIEKLAAVKGVGHVHVDRSTAVVKAAMETAAVASKNRLFLICPDDENVTPSDARAEVDALTSPSDRLIYCGGHTSVLDTNTGELVTVQPTDWASHVLAQTQIDDSPATLDTVVRGLTAGIRAIVGAFADLPDAEYDLFRGDNGRGIMALEARPDRGGFNFVDHVSTLPDDGTDARKITARRQKDFLFESLGALADQDVNQPNSQGRRDARQGRFEDFLGALFREERIVRGNASGEAGDFIVDLEVLNTPESRALGQQQDLVRVGRIAESEQLVIVGEVGATVQFSEQ